MFFSFPALTLVLLFDLFASTLAVPELKYTEIEALKASCAPHDTCSVHREEDDNNLIIHNCECNTSCNRHLTCCIDSPHVFGRIKSRTLPRGTCNSVIGTDDAVFMVSKCNERWRGSSRIRSMCEKEVDNLRDPIGIAPVSNRRTQTTYKNFFCAVCNDDHQDVIVWTIKLKTRQAGIYDQNQIIDALVFDESKNQWGVFEGDAYGSMEFKPIGIAFKIPDSLKGTQKSCPPGLVSECAKSWKDENVRLKCEAYMGIVYIPTNTSEGLEEVAYRNIHCAICNYASYASIDVCSKPEKVKWGKPALSFSLLLDVNMSDGNKVGEVNRCGKNEMYDPFSQKCRTLLCAIPGYTMKDRTCVRS